MVGESRGGVQGQEEEVLDDDGGARDEGCSKGRVFLEAGPGEVDIEQEQENSQTDNGALERMLLARHGRG